MRFFPCLKLGTLFHIHSGSRNLNDNETLKFTITVRNGSCGSSLVVSAKWYRFSCILSILLLVADSKSPKLCNTLVLKNIEARTSYFQKCLPTDAAVSNLVQMSSQVVSNDDIN